MDDALIVTIYVVIDDTMKALEHRSHCLSSLSDAEILTIAVLAARYYGNHHARSVGQLTGTAYFPRVISPSRVYGKIKQAMPTFDDALPPVQHPLT